MDAQTALRALPWLLGGVATWSLLEYLIHRFLGHAKKGRNPFRVEHVQHHATTHYFAPTLKKAMVAAPVIAVAWTGLAFLLGAVEGSAYALGLSTMYVAYEVAHRRAHTHPPTGPYSRWLRRNHFHHHFKNPRANHGVTSPIWDRVFGTHEEPVQIRVPEKHSMTWLVDPATGEVRDEFAADYVILRRAGAVVEPPR